MIKTTLLLAVLAAEPDGWLTTKAKLSLITKGELKGSQVHVDANDGVVTLYGKVQDEAQKQRAERTIRDIKGVTGVRNLLQIVSSAQEKTIARNDADIKDQADKMLKEDPALKDSKISVQSVDKGVVLLTGKANTFSDQLRAVNDVDQIAGVKKVASEIQAPERYGYEERNLSFDKRETPRTSHSDTGITAAVKMKLLTTDDVPATAINVDTNDGVVTLFGEVPNELAKDKAENVAAKVDGVTRVQNQLAVVTKGQEKIREAKDEVINRILKDKYSNNADYKDVKFDVKGGAVRLTGTVPTGWEKLQVVRLARGTEGVKSVTENIEVKGAQKEDKRQF